MKKRKEEKREKKIISFVPISLPCVATAAAAKLDEVAEIEVKPSF